MSAAARKPLYANLTVQVLTAIALGVMLGMLAPQTAVAMKPFSDVFIRLIKMVIGPIVFLTLVTGIASVGDMKKVGKVGIKALLYFEVVTTLALVIGLVVVNVIKPGAGVTIASGTDAYGALTPYNAGASHEGMTAFLVHLIPDNVVNAFAQGELLQILVFAVLFGIALALSQPAAAGILRACEVLLQVLFVIVGMIMRVAPLGAFGAMAYTVGQHGVATLASMGKLMASVYLTMAVFIFLGLGAIARLSGFRLWPLLCAIREELVIVLGTSSSESVLPRIMAKLQTLGCSRPVVGLVIPTGYSFNLDGSSIYLSMAAMFIAQVYQIDLSIPQQIGLLGLLMLTSKGAAAVTGGAFVTLAATLSATHILPVEGLAFLLGVDRFMSEARAITNLIGNSVATMVIARSEGDPATTNVMTMAANGDAPQWDN